MRRKEGPVRENTAVARRTPWPGSLGLSPVIFAPNPSRFISTSFRSESSVPRVESLFQFENLLPGAEKLFAKKVRREIRWNLHTRDTMADEKCC
jgi:hypothetical protein